MIESISALLSVAFAAGLNIYATVLALGVMHRFEVIQLPSGLDVVATTPVLIAAGVLYAVEFVADKIPLVDSIWDAIHTIIRPAAGAVLAYSLAGTIDPTWQFIAALAGGGLAFTSHAAKASTRAAVNVSPEPFSNWILSLAEDGLAFFVVWLAGSYPTIALAVVLFLIVVALAVIWSLSRVARRVFRRARA